MLQVNRTKASTITNATVNDCLVLTSVTSSDCLNTVSPLFTTCTGDYCVSSDTSANFGANSLLSQPIASWLDGNNDINTTGQTALTGTGWNSSNIVEWAWSSAVVIAATLSGTIAPTSTEVDIVGGGKTIILTISGDTWKSSGTEFDAQRQSIISGLTSAQSELFGWNNEVRDKEVVTSVVRTSDTIVTITLSSAINYDISATETITATIPNTALTNSTSDITPTETFTITPTENGFKIVWANGVNNLIGGM